MTASCLGLNVLTNIYLIMQFSVRIALIEMRLDELHGDGFCWSLTIPTALVTVKLTVRTNFDDSCQVCVRAPGPRKTSTFNQRFQCHVYVHSKDPVTKSGVFFPRWFNCESGMDTWLHIFIWGEVITNPCPNCNGDLTKPQLKLGHRWIFT